MRTFVSLTLLLGLLVAPVVAQQGGPGLLTQEEGKKLQQLRQTSAEAMRDKEYEKALQLLAEKRPLLTKALNRVQGGEVDLGDKKELAVMSLSRELASDWYNTACCLSLTDKKPEAIDALKKAVGYGFLDIEHMRVDKDLDPIREDPGYKEIIASIEYNEAYEVYKPDGIGESAPLLVLLHGTRGNEGEFLEKFKPLANAKKVILLSVRAPVMVSKDSYDWAPVGGDQKSGLKKIDFAIGKVKSAEPVDPARIYLLGVGEGGKFGSTFALSHPDLVKGVVSVNAYWNRYAFADHFAAAKAAGLALCLVEGKEDPNCDRAEAGVKQLEKAEIAAKFITFEGGRDLPDDVASVLGPALDFVMNR